MTRRALELLASKRNDAYEAALAALADDTSRMVRRRVARGPERAWRVRGACHTPTVKGCGRFLEGQVLHGSKIAGRSWATGH